MGGKDRVTDRWVTAGVTDQWMKAPNAVAIATIRTMAPKMIAAVSSPILVMGFIMWWLLRWPRWAERSVAENQYPFPRPRRLAGDLPPVQPDDDPLGGRGVAAECHRVEWHQRVGLRVVGGDAAARGRIGDDLEAIRAPLYAVVRDRKPLASQWFELSLAAAGVVSFGAAKLITAVITHAGGYAGLPLKTIPAPPHLLPAHFVLTMEGILSIYGADLFGVSAGNVGGPASGSLGTTVAVVIALVHLVGVGLAIWGVCRAFRRFFSSDLIASLLAAGIVINLAAYVFSIDPQTLFDTREIVALLPFGAVLAGRLLTGSLARARLEPVLVGVLACYVIALGYGVAQPAAVDLEQPVVGWLEAHHLYTGLGTYAEANIITLDSDGRVAIRTASWRTTGAVPRSFESKASWYDPRASYANFILSNRADGNNVSVVPMRDILPFAGPPAHVYHYKTFTIMVWNKNLLADLGSPPSSLPGNIP